PKITTASANLVGYASPYNPTFMQWWQVVQAGFAARGFDQARARLQALALLGRAISRQAAVVAFDYAFAVMGVLFLCCLPLVLLLRRGQRAEEAISPSE